MLVHPNPYATQANITLRKLDQEPFCFWGTAAPSCPLLELMVDIGAGECRKKKVCGMGSGSCLVRMWRGRGRMASQCLEVEQIAMQQPA